MEKFFRIFDFRFKIHFKTFWIDSDKKFFSTKIFWLCQFSLFLSTNDLVPEKFCNEKTFSFSSFSVTHIYFEICSLKYVLTQSESIPTKKFFDQNFWLRHFSRFFGPKITFFEVFGVKKIFQKKVFVHRFKNFITKILSYQRLM